MSPPTVCKNIIVILILIGSFSVAVGQGKKFAVQEGAILYHNPKRSTPDTTELLFLDSAILDAYKMVYPKEDFEAEVVEVTELTTTNRRLGTSRKLPGTNWGGAIRVGGRCTYCSPSRRRMNSFLRTRGKHRLLARQICANLANGPVKIFHDVSDCEIYLEY